MNTKVKHQPRRKYDDEFKRDALQMIANGQPCAFWYVRFASNGGVGVYEEEVLEVVIQQPESAKSMKAGVQ